MSRRPVYGKNPKWRIVSVHGGRWQLQCLTGTSPGDRDRDPWESHCGPQNFETASRQLAAHGGEK